MRISENGLHVSFPEAPLSRSFNREGKYRGNNVIAVAGCAGSQVVDEKIGHFGAMIVGDARGLTLHISHQPVERVAQIRNADHPEGGPVPKTRGVQLSDGYVETSAQAVFQAAHDLPFILKRLRRFNAQLQGEKGDHRQFVTRESPASPSFTPRGKRPTAGAYAMASAAMRSVTKASITSPTLMSP